ncbi:hypothetical protein I79_017222 [Cricetulus griseus]|uniref:Uncharacterized protein n=1 Tax=Cricetulus griseus TaxID=10029 RepID=G3I1G7_CRIGR|nr:hypothetical protein I79_017222 [Cricetulus griseus]
MSLLPGAVLRYGVIGCICRSALEPWQLGAGHTVPVKATRQYKALFTQKKKDPLRTRTESLRVSARYDFPSHLRSFERVCDGNTTGTRSRVKGEKVPTAPS